ncbi:MAG: nitroreductase family protein [Tissierellia bacterium]|nr:nitroreductase family protein [Tissierellia bacterium]
MNFKDLAKKRYSCRSFSDKRVEPEKIENIIKTGILAPTAVNRQPYQIFSVQSKEGKEAIKESTSCTYGADEFLIVGYRKEDAWVREFDDRNFGDVDASIVATHLMMAIFDEGLATTWVGHFDAPRLKEQFSALKDYDLVALFPIGYPAEDGGPSERHFDRKSKDELCTII